MSSDTDGLSRRRALGLAAASVLASCTPAGDHPDPDAPVDTDESDVPQCVLTPEQTAGPFYFDVDEVRSDIREDSQGVPLAVVLTVVRTDCSPIRDAVVDLWHCDAAGRYSGYESQGTAGETFLRGIQVTDGNGSVSFLTVYPGWYPGRTIHLHVRVHLDGQSAVTTQLYFDDTWTDEALEHEAYAARNPRSTRNEDDHLFRNNGSSLLVTVERTEDGYQARATLGIAGT